MHRHNRGTGSPCLSDSVNELRCTEFSPAGPFYTVFLSFTLYSGPEDRGPPGTRNVSKVRESSTVVIKGLKKKKSSCKPL